MRLQVRFPTLARLEKCKLSFRDVLVKHSLNKIQKQWKRERNTGATFKFINLQIISTWFDSKMKNTTDLRSRAQSRIQGEEVVSCMVRLE
jgi:hypothetical protein